MNVKANKTKKQANVENQAVNLLSKEELCKQIEGVEKELTYHTERRKSQKIQYLCGFWEFCTYRILS